MVPEIGAGGHQPGELPLGRVSGAAAGGIDGFGYVRGLAVDRTELLPQVGVADDEECPVLRVAAGGGADRRVEDLGDQLLRHRVWLEAADRSSRIDRLEQSDVRHRQLPRAVAM